MYTHPTFTEKESYQSKFTNKYESSKYFSKSTNIVKIKEQIC